MGNIYLVQRAGEGGYCGCVAITVLYLLIPSDGRTEPINQATVATPHLISTHCNHLLHTLP